MKGRPGLTRLTQDAGVTGLAHTGEGAGALHARAVVKAGSVFALVHVCDTHTDTGEGGIFTQLINISATVILSLDNYALLAVKGIRRVLMHRSPIKEVKHSEELDLCVK